jgi:hypothetical protein
MFSILCFYTQMLMLIFEVKQLFHFSIDKANMILNFIKWDSFNYVMGMIEWCRLPTKHT